MNNLGLKEEFDLDFKPSIDVNRLEFKGVCQITHVRDGEVLSVDTGSNVITNSGKVEIAALGGAITLKSELGVIDISTTSMVVAGGIRLHTSASPINIVSDELTQGALGMINLLLGSTGAMGYVSMKPLAMELFTPTIMTLQGNYVGITSSTPISISGGTGSLKGALDDIIDEIQKITVATGTGNSSTPLNTAAWTSLKIKIGAFTI